MYMCVYVCMYIYKESLDQDITTSQVPLSDLKSHINHFISSKWQERWSSCRDN